MRGFSWWWGGGSEGRGEGRDEGWGIEDCLRLSF